MTKLFLELLVATKHITKLVILHQQNVGVGLCLTNECQHIKITHYHQSPSSLSILTLLTRVTRQTTVNTDRLNSSNYMSNDLQSQHERITLDRELTGMNSLCVSLNQPSSLPSFEVLFNIYFLYVSILSFFILVGSVYIQKHGPMKLELEAGCISSL